MGEIRERKREKEESLENVSDRQRKRRQEETKKVSES